MIWGFTGYISNLHVIVSSGRTVLNHDREGLMLFHEKQAFACTNYFKQAAGEFASGAIISFYVDLSLCLSRLQMHMYWYIKKYKNQENLTCRTECVHTERDRLRFGPDAGSGTWASGHEEWANNSRKLYNNIIILRCPSVHRQACLFNFITLVCLIRKCLIILPLHLSHNGNKSPQKYEEKRRQHQVYPG